MSKLISVGATVIFGILCIVFWVLAVNRHTEAAENAFAEAKAATYEQTKAEKEQAAFNKAYEENKVVNEVTISVGSLRSESKLEVLRAYDVEYIIEDAEDNEDGMLSWLKVPGEGTYTVDLTAAEFIVDEERKYVLVRIPKPELTDCGITYGEVEQLLFQNKGLNDNIQLGVTLAEKQLRNAYVAIEKEFARNLNFSQSAEASAKRMVVSLVKAFNVKIPDLTVEVEFFN